MMKRFCILVLAVCLLLTALCACSATGRIEDPYSGYGNVSTTPDGRVNGTNDYLNGTYGSGWQGSGASGYTGTQRGTGMAGGR